MKIAESDVEARRDYRRTRIELTPTSDWGRTNAAVTFDYFQIPGENNPVILILPISGGRRYLVEEIFARYFARHGFAVIIAHRWKPPNEFDLGAIDRWLRLSLEENQLALDWIETRPELDAGRIGLFGTSMGGIRGVLLTALDPRIKASVFGLAGSDLPAILAQSRDRGIVRRRTALLSQGGWTPAELEAALRESITCEPGDFAPHVDPRRSLLVLGMFDRVVPFRQGWKLREQLGKPRTLLLPTGHFTAVLAIPAIQMESVEFFETRFGVGAPSGERHRARSPRNAPW